MSAEHHLDLVGARVVQTLALLLSRRAILDVLAARALGMLHGPAGSGKTFAARLVLDELRVARAWVQFPSRPTMLTSPVGCIGNCPALTPAARTGSISPSS